MLAALLIVFREVFEAGLIVGIVMAVTTGVAGRGLWVAGGVAAGVLGACLVALFTSGLSSLFGGSGQEVFNAGILGFAVIMLTWHNVWMARHGRELAAELQAAGEAVVAGSKSLAALAIVVAIAVLREGSEVVLFLYGVAAAQGGASWGMVGGGFVGLILGSLVCLATYLGLITIPTRYLFGVTSTLIAFLAAGLAAQAIAFLQQANILTAYDGTVWDTSWILSEFQLSGPRPAHADWLCRPADRNAAHRLCGDAGHHRCADEALLRTGSAAAADSVRRLRSRLRRHRPGDGVVGAAVSHENFAKIGELGLQALDIQANDAAARERHDDDARRRILRLEFNGEQIEPCVLVRLIEIAALAAEHALEAQCRAATPIIRFVRGLGIGGADPVEAAEPHDEAVLLRLPENIGNTYQGVLQMRRHHFNIVAIERNEFKLVNGSVHQRALPGLV